jgi:hypothetical protein
VSDKEESTVESWGRDGRRRFARLQETVSNCMKMISIAGGYDYGKGESQEELLKR